MVDDLEEYPQEPQQPQQPQQTEKPEKKSDGLLKAIMTVAILIGGMYAVMFILDYYLDNFAETLNMDVSMMDSLTGLGYTFIYAMVAILAILIVIYIITKIRKPAKSL